MEIKFRTATLEDVDKIVDLCNDCFGDNTNKKAARAIFEKTKNDPNVIHVIGEIEGVIVAHTRIQIVETMFKGMETFAILNHVCVSGHYRRHNIASKMLEIIKKVCKDKNCISIKLWSMNFREAAHACYQKFGFKKEECGFFQLNL